MERIFNNVVFTNHALERLKQRGIKQGDAWATLTHPQSSREAQRKGSFVFYRTYDNRRVEVVASKNERGQWVVLSVWDKYVDGTTGSAVKSRDSLWRKVFLELKSIFFR